MKVLLIGPYGIGNTIMALPAMRALRRKLPYARIDLLCLLPSVWEMVNFLPDFKGIFEEIFLLPKSLTRRIKMLSKLFRARYDYSVLLFPSARFHYNLLSYLIHAKERIGSEYPDANFRRGHFLNTINIPVVVGIHDVYQNIRLLAPLGVEADRSVRKIASRWANDKAKVIGIHPGSKREDAYKRWNVMNFRILVQNVLKEFPEYGIKLFFGPDEIELADFFGDMTCEPKVRLIVDQPLKKVFKEIGECEIFISNDSGLMHVANFLGCYTIGIWGPSDFRRTGPFNEPKKIIYHDIPCRPCFHTYHVRSHKFKCIYGRPLCLEKVGVEDVMRAVKDAHNELCTSYT